MNSRLMGITVERPQDGCYYWVIHEDVQHDGHYETLERAPRASPSYSEALADGYWMLQRINGRRYGLHELRNTRAS